MNGVFTPSQLSIECPQIGYQKLYCGFDLDIDF